MQKLSLEDQNMDMNVHKKHNKTKTIAVRTYVVEYLQNLLSSTASNELACCCNYYFLGQGASGSEMLCLFGLPFTICFILHFIMLYCSCSAHKFHLLCSCERF